MIPCVKLIASRRAAFVFASLLLLCSTTVAAQHLSPTDSYNISYQLSMSNPASHLFEVSMTVETPKAEDAVDFQMPRWSPGRYAVFDLSLIHI